VTDGQASGFDNTVTREQVAALRRQELTAAANMLGLSLRIIAMIIIETPEFEISRERYGFDLKNHLPFT
jgi:LmbE family N-acetylglucosaminyl deacetylase